MTTTVDFSPILDDLIQLLAVIILAIGVPLAWKAVAWLQTHLKLKVLAVDDAQRAVIDQALQKAIGSAVAGLSTAAQGAIKANPVTVDVKSHVAATAAQYAVDHVPAALAHFGLTQDDVVSMVESRLGMAAMSNSMSPATLATSTATTPATTGTP